MADVAPELDEALKQEDKPPSPYAFIVNGEVLFDPEPHQLTIMQLVASEKYPNIFVYGNRGGGKSVTARALCHGLALKYPKLKYVIVRRSYTELNKTHLAFLDDEMKKLGGSYHKTEHVARYPNGSLGFYSQCDNDADVKKVLGAEAAIVVFDEAPELEWEWMVMIGASIRAPKSSGHPQIALYLGNPLGTSIAQLWSYFIDKDVDAEDDPEYNPDDWHAIELRLEDNSHLDHERYRKRFAGLPAHVLKAWREGERVIERALFQLRPAITVEERQPDGTIVRTKRPYHVIDHLPTFEGESILKQPWVQIYRAFDMGFYPDPAYCLWLAVFGRRVIAFHEKTWTRTIAKDIAADMKRITRDLIGDKRVTATIADPTIKIHGGHDAVSIHDIFERNGVPMDLAVNDREKYAHAIHSALQEEVDQHTPRLTILRSGCPYLVKSIPQMRFDEHNPMKMADHKHDHPPITLAYHLLSAHGALTTTRPDTRPQRPAWMQEYMPKPERFVLGRSNTRR